MDQDDDLEYHVTMPSPLFTSSTPRLGEGSSVIQRRRSSIKWDKEPLIILFGWAGCRDRDLAKYSKLYEERGCITLRYILPAKSIFFNPDQVCVVAEKLVDVIYEMVFYEHPILFHSFSNGGCYIYRSLIYHLDEKDKMYTDKLNVRGAIFDSAPGKRRFRSLLIALFQNSTGGCLSRALKAAIFTLTIIVSDVVTKMKLLFLGVRQQLGQRHTYWEAMLQEPSRWPQLYLYSSRDNICLSQDVEEMIEARREAGVAVYSKRWSDSPHVKHLLHHPESYVKAVYDFMDGTLEGSPINITSIQGEDASAGKQE